MQFTAEIGSRPILEAGLCDASICLSFSCYRLPPVALSFLCLGLTSWEQVFSWSL